MTTQELVELLHEAIESGMSVCYDDTFAAAASRLSEMEEEIKRLRDEIEKRERDAANDRAFNKGGPEAEYGKQSILEIIALSDDLIDLPEVPSINTMRALRHAAMNFHKHGFDLWALGKQLQNRAPMGADQAWTPAHRKERRITMSEWQPIETAPQTGCEIQYRRVIDGRIAFDGLCKWGVRCARAPARQPFTAYSPGFGLITDPPDSNVDTATWITPDEMYLVPMPTHWAPT